MAANLTPEELAQLKEFFRLNQPGASVMTQRGGDGPDTYSNEFKTVNIGGKTYSAGAGGSDGGVGIYSSLVDGQDNLYDGYNPTTGQFTGQFSASNDFMDKFGRALPYVTGAALGGIAAFGGAAGAGAAGAGASDMAMINGGGFANTPSYLVPNLSALPAEAMVSGGGISGLPGYLMNPGGGAGAEAAAGGGILGGATGASGTAAGSGVATGTAGVSGAAGAAGAAGTAANSAGGLLGSTAGKIAAAAAGGLLGSQTTTNSTNSQSKIDPRMEKYLYGDGNTQGILDQAYQWQQANKSGLNDQMRQGLASINRVASDPSGYQAIQKQGLSLMNQPVAGNPFSTGQATLQQGYPQALRNLGFK